MRLYISVSDGKFKFMDMSESHDHVVGTFELTDIEGMRKFFKENRPESVMCSSSVDWPEDDGAPEGFDANAALQEAMDPGNDPKVQAQLKKLSETLAACGDQAVAGFARALFFNPPESVHQQLDLMVKHFPELAEIEG
jgi:hypothetical protein